MSRLTFPSTRGRSMLDRFEEKFMPVTESGCWIWIASSHERGYGLFHTGRDIRKGKMEFAHRVSYELYKGYQPTADDSVCHKCDNPFCVNPDHLFIGTHQDNMSDMASKGRTKLAKLRLTEDDVIRIIEYPANNKTTAEKFGIDGGYCSRLRRFKIPHWQYLSERYKIGAEL